jgi:predicted aspartyl protease
MRIKIIILLFFVANQTFGQKVNLNQGEIIVEDYLEEIDFEFLRNKVIVPVKINEKTYRFILDTGAPNIISKELDEVLNPKIIDTIPIYDASEKSEKLKLVLIEKIELGNLEFVNTATLVQDFGSDNPLKCFGIDGFIGSNMLRNSIIQFDLKNKKLRITDNKKKLNLKKKYSSKIKLTETQSNPYVWIELKGKDKGREEVLIDTGMDGLYDLSMTNYKIFENKNIFKVIGVSKGASGVGMFGSPESGLQYQLLLPQMKIKHFTLENLTTITGNDNNSRIGSELLKYGILTIDYINKRFYFQSQNESVIIKDEDVGFSGTLENGNLIVGLVWDDELKNEISYGDVILEINGKPFNLCELLNKNFFEIESILDLKVKKSNGELISIKVEKRTPANIGYK